MNLEAALSGALRDSLNFASKHIERLSYLGKVKPIIYFFNNS